MAAGNKGRITKSYCRPKAEGVRRNRKKESVSLGCKVRGGKNNRKERERNQTPTPTKVIAVCSPSDQTRPLNSAAMKRES
jgi:hypothetical protein